MLLNHQIRWLETSCETAGVSEGRKRCFFSAKQQVQLWPVTVLNGLIYHDIKRHHTYGPTNSYFYGLISWYISPASGVSSVHLYHTITVGCAKAISGGESSERWPILCWARCLWPLDHHFGWWKNSSNHTKFICECLVLVCPCHHLMIVFDKCPFTWSFFILTFHGFIINIKAY